MKLPKNEIYNQRLFFSFLFLQFFYIYNLVNFSPKISKISQIYFFLIKKIQNFPNLFVEIEFFWENKTLPSHNSQRVFFFFFFNFVMLLRWQSFKKII